MAEDSRLRRITIPIPNPGLSEWLAGPQCRDRVSDITSQICSVYRATLPEITGNLKSGADFTVNIGSYWGESPRWFGHVINTARSYRKQRGRPYGRVIEYGGGKYNAPGQHQLARAAAIVTGQEVPLSGSGGVKFAPRAGAHGGFRDSTTGRFTKAPRRGRS